MRLLDQADRWLVRSLLALARWFHWCLGNAGIIGAGGLLGGLIALGSWSLRDTVWMADKTIATQSLFTRMAPSSVWPPATPPLALIAIDEKDIVRLKATAPSACGQDSLSLALYGALTAAAVDAGAQAVFLDIRLAACPYSDAEAAAFLEPLLAANRRRDRPATLMIAAAETTAPDRTALRLLEPAAVEAASTRGEILLVTSELLNDQDRDRFARGAPPWRRACAVAAERAKEIPARTPEILLAPHVIIAEQRATRETGAQVRDRLHSVLPPQALTGYCDGQATPTSPDLRGAAGHWTQGGADRLIRYAIVDERNPPQGDHAPDFTLLNAATLLVSDGARFSPRPLAPSTLKDAVVVIGRTDGDDDRYRPPPGAKRTGNSDMPGALVWLNAMGATAVNGPATTPLLPTIALGALVGLLVGAARAWGTQLKRQKRETHASLLPVVTGFGILLIWGLSEFLAWRSGDWLTVSPAQLALDPVLGVGAWVWARRPWRQKR